MLYLETGFWLDRSRPARLEAGVDIDNAVASRTVPRS
jgi:hypothetical protein